jgi:hypothetical protein
VTNDADETLTQEGLSSKQTMDVALKLGLEVPAELGERLPRHAQK